MRKLWSKGHLTCNLFVVTLQVFGESSELSSSLFGAESTELTLTQRLLGLENNSASLIDQQVSALQQLTQQASSAGVTSGAPRDPREPPPPPPQPPKPKSKKLPPNWKTATDAEGKQYYYHTVTRYDMIWLSCIFLKWFAERYWSFEKVGPWS